MKQVVWKLRPASLPLAERYCKKCGKKAPFFCSGQFRVNAQKKRVDVWLIYRCSCCSSRWNVEILSRVSPQEVDPALLEGFFQNDPALAERYAADIPFLQRSGAQVLLPDFMLTGEGPPPDEAAAITIQAGFPVPLRAASLLRKKLGLSWREFEELTGSGRLTAIPPRDLKKCRLQDGMCLLLQPPAQPGQEAGTLRQPEG